MSKVVWPEMRFAAGYRKCSNNGMNKRGVDLSHGKKFGGRQPGARTVAQQGYQTPGLFLSFCSALLKEWSFDILFVT